MFAILSLTLEKKHATGSNLTFIRLKEALRAILLIKHLHSLMWESTLSATSSQTEATVKRNSSKEVFTESREAYKRDTT